MCPHIEEHSDVHPIPLMVDHTMEFIGYDTIMIDQEEALNYPDREKLTESIHKELQYHINKKHWKFVPL